MLLEGFTLMGHHDIGYVQVFLIPLKYFAQFIAKAKYPMAICLTLPAVQSDPFLSLKLRGVFTFS